MKYSVLFVLALSIGVWGQTPSSGPAKTSGKCSPATTGNNNTYYFAYCGTDPEQGKKMVELLNKILLNQDMTAANAKLDELLKIVSNLGPPPERNMKNENAYAAIALLNSAPRSSRVRFTIIGGDREINAFANQVGMLFQLTQGTWIIDGVNTIGQLISVGEGNIISHGEGFHCSIANAASGAGEIAIKALARSGYPCVRDPDRKGDPPPRGMPVPGQTPSPILPVDLYLSIGTRIVPQ
jgi:hypothetical protein